MTVAVVDTGVAGMADADDGYHDPATEIVRGMNHGDLQTGRVTNHALLETLNLIHERKRHAMAVETYERLNRTNLPGSRYSTRPRGPSPGPSTCSGPTMDCHSETRASPRGCSARASNTCTSSTTTSTCSAASPDWGRPTIRLPDRESIPKSKAGHATSPPGGRVRQVRLGTSTTGGGPPSACRSTTAWWGSGRSRSAKRSNPAR